MKTEKIEKEKWRQILKEACYLKNISINKIIKQFNIPNDKAELVLQSVHFSRNKKRDKQNYVRTMNSKKAQGLIASLRADKVKWKEIAKIVGLSEKHCIKLHKKTKDVLIIEEELSPARKCWLDLVLKGYSYTTRSYKNRKPKEKSYILTEKEREYVQNQLINNPAYNNKKLSDFLLLSFEASASINPIAISNFTNDTFFKIDFDCGNGYNTEEKSAWDTYRIAKSYGFPGTPKDFFTEIKEKGTILIYHHTKLAHIEIFMKTDNLQ
ncbi:MAG: hypothetical protein FWD14_01835 [Treponema sp.]|nr:hypothetical protein [Treponema sp.]